MVQKNSRQELVGVGAILGTAFIFGSFAIFTRIIAYNLPLFYAASIRNLINTIVFGLIILINRRLWQRPTPKNLIWLTLRTFSGLTAFFGSYLAFLTLSIGTTYFIYFGASTIVGYLLGWIWFKETLTPLKILSLILAIAGLYFVYTLDVSITQPIAILWAAASGMGAAGYFAISKKLPPHYSASMISFIDSLICAVLVTIVSLAMGEKWLWPSTSVPYLANILFGLSYVVTAQLIIIGFRKLQVQIASLLMLSEILFGLLLGYLVFHETVPASSLFGGLLIIAAMVLPEVAELRKKSHV